MLTCKPSRKQDKLKFRTVSARDTAIVIPPNSKSCFNTVCQLNAFTLIQQSAKPTSKQRSTNVYGWWTQYAADSQVFEIKDKFMIHSLLYFSTIDSEPNYY